MPEIDKLGRGICYALALALALPVLFSATAPQVSAGDELSSTADSFVASHDPSSNFGTSTILAVGPRTVPDGEYRTFIKFDLSGVENIGTAVIKLYCFSEAGDDITTEIWSVDNDNWTESGITWNNQPSLVAKLDEKVISGTGWFSWDVTSWAHNEENENMSLGFKSDNTGDAYDQFYSRNAGAYNPILEITTGAGYKIELRWEDNDALVTDSENRALTAFMSNYGAQENVITGGTLYVVYPECPYWIRLRDENENYWRGRIPTLENVTITFWLTSSPTEYTLSLIDYAGGFGPPDGQLLVKRYIGENLAVINEDWWSAERTMQVYLTQGERYTLHAKKPTETRSVGPFDATSDTTREITVGGIVFENVTYIHNIIAWSATFDGENITVSYQDNTENTINASVKIYDLENGSLMNDDNFTTSTFSMTWTEGNENRAYKVKLSVYDHLNFGTFEEIKLLGQPSEYWDVPVGGFGGMLGSAPASLVAIGSIVLLIFVGATFSGISAGFGTIVMGLAAIMLYAFGWLPVEWGVLIFVLFIAFLLKFGRRG